MIVRVEAISQLLNQILLTNFLFWLMDRFRMLLEYAMFIHKKM